MWPLLFCPVGFFIQIGGVIIMKGKHNCVKGFIFMMLNPSFSWFVAMLVIALYSAVHSVVSPYVMKVFLDCIANAEPGKLIKASAIPAVIFILMSLSMSCLWRVSSYFALKAYPKLKNDILLYVMSYLRSQTFGFFQDHLSGDISAKITDLVTSIVDIIHNARTMFINIATLLFSIVMVGFVSLYFSLLFLSISVIFILVARHASHAIKPYASDFASARAENFGSVVDTISNILDLKLFAREKYEESSLKQGMAIVIAKDKAMHYKNLKSTILLGLFAFILEFLSILLLLYLGNISLVTIGDFVFIMLLSIKTMDLVWRLAEGQLYMAEQIGTCQKALDTIFANRQQCSAAGAPNLELKTGTVVIDKVSFGYENNHRVIKNLNLKITGGTKVGLVGYSGAGKSTLAQLIPRLFNIDSGNILIDDQDIKEVNLLSLREHISFIPQVPNLFHRSVFANIHYGDINASLEDVVAAAQQAHAHEFITSLPQGYDTIVGERGVKLSGGQRQRIAIARAILKNAPILILDEATSSLDSITERLIQDSLAKAMQNRTVLVVAHRLSTILNMDAICVMDKGEIIEMGNHQQLIKKNGLYKSLWDSQSGHSFI